ncbi:MAG TPA: ribosome-associated translation inhibitor RaiA [Pyrinomonadaceae bacterium]|jgi:putative sigma-54 modulation protein|nr:ribosome-associated translation inhibitor RaiA [Pyrinomonadaceae bacterium]
MKFEYTGRHLEVTPAMRSHVESHFARLGHLFNGSSNAHVIIEVERGKHHAEIVVNWHDHTLTAKSALPDMYFALSKTIDKIEKQALKLKNKIIDRKHTAERTASVVSDGGVKPAAGNGPRIINMRKSSSKPMTTEEALLKLSSQKDGPVVYQDAETDKFSVLYRRKDGNFGLIQP